MATNWTWGECAEVERALASRPERIRVHWLRVGREEDPTRALERPGAVDVVLGGPIASYRQLSIRKRLRSLDASADRPWREVPRGPIGQIVNSAARDAIGLPGLISPEDPRLADRVSMVDPRSDPDGVLAARFEAAGSRPDAWASEYARLVRIAANARPIAVGFGGTARDLERGTAVVVPAASGRFRSGPGLEFTPTAGQAAQGVGVASDSPRIPAALAFLEVLREKVVAAPERPPGDTLLIADLLGATLVDAQAELRGARVALAREGYPERAVHWMTEAPPWPPASIARLRARPEGDSLIATLAGQIAPDPVAREWLLRSVELPPRPIDGTILDELASAAGGRLVGEPRFREWLRSEWTAWARQRYRRVAKNLDDPRFPPP